MAEFQELIKNFNKCRDYVRDFFVYGFKSRQDFTSDRKSARTYDDERRRITSWLSEYVVEDMTEQNHVKNISLQIDSNLLDTNPLFSVWKTKSFTDNDIMLHFYLLDILGGCTYSSEHSKTMSTDSDSSSCRHNPTDADSDSSSSHHNPDDANPDSSSGNSKHSAYSANELADILSEDYSFPADTQLVRRKCNEYVKEGLLETEKAGKTLLYKCSLTWDELFDHVLTNITDSTSFINAISLLQLDCPFGYIGNTILERLQKENNVFRVKHSFPVFTLEDEIAYELLLAKNNHSYVKMDIMSNKTGQSPRPVYGVPLKIFVSTRTGRRYVCIYHTIHEKGRTLTNDQQKTSTASSRISKPKFHFRNVRLDQIKSVSVIKPDDTSGSKSNAITATIDAYNTQEEALMNNLPFVWGVSFEGMRTKTSLTLRIDEQYERFILNRLEREGKGGELTKLADNTFLYEKIVFDANEMFPWLRTFIGRIVDIHFFTMNQNGEVIRENIYLRRQFLEDIKAVTKLYL